MKICILNSGSSANSSLISSKSTSILVDAGLSGKETVKRLEGAGSSPGGLNGILVSHGHRDHTNSIGVLARRLKIPVFINKATLEEVEPYAGNIPDLRLIETGSSFEINDIQIETFPVSHDSADPMGFVFRSNNSKISYITDLGRVTESILKRIRDSKMLIIESNHDIEMLINGPYPEVLKKRILGPKGHLSNIAAANTLLDAIGSNTDHVILAHLSENNNHPDLVRSTVSEIMAEEDLGDVDLQIASRYYAMDPISL